MEKDNQTNSSNELKNGLNDLQNNIEKIRDTKDETKIVEDYTATPLIYSVMDNPPVHITIVCAFQHCLISLSGQLVVSLLVAEAVCASENNIFKARLLSSTLFMNGVTTVAMNLFGIRLPLFQGASSAYVIPLLLVAGIQGTFCSSLTEEAQPENAMSMNTSVSGLSSNMSEDNMERIISNVQAMQGSLMVAGLIHAALGFTGLIGVLLRFVGPLTIVPTMILIFVFIVRPILKFVEVNWGIAFSTIAVACILFLYLSKYNAPVPVWTPSAGFRIIRYPLHQVFAILISIIINWALCAIMTSAGVFPDDPNANGFKARTDARASIIYENPWFSFPYPGQYGPFGFSGAAFISCLVATLISVLDSVGDYFACARVARVPAPPTHAVNRGLFIEGLCTMLSGAVGCGHATSTYGGNIGAIGVTKVASRQVFLFTGILYILFGIFGKFSAFFITIPYPVLGGAIVVMFGIFFGVIVANLEVTDMSSPRNIAILGLSVFIGLMVPTWTEKVKIPIQTGKTQDIPTNVYILGMSTFLFMVPTWTEKVNIPVDRIGKIITVCGTESADKIIAMLLGNPSLVGTCLALFLDNTVPGTREERGISAWHVGEDEDDSKVDYTKFNNGYEVYRPLLPERMLQSPIMKYIPFLPYRRNIETNESNRII